MPTSSFLEVTACWMLKSPCVSSTLFLISDPERWHAFPDSFCTPLPSRHTSTVLLPHKYHLLLHASHVFWCHTLTFNLSEHGIWLLPRRKVVFLPATPLPSWSFPQPSGKPLPYNCHSGFTPVIMVAICTWNYPLDPICSSKSDTTCYPVL